MKDKLNKLIDKYQKLLDQAVADTGINIHLPRPFNLTPKDLVSTHKERRWAASSLLSRYGKEKGLVNGLHSNASVQLNTLNKTLKISALVSQEEIYLPQVCYLLDYKTSQWYSLKLDISSRVYENKLETFSFGDILTFPIHTVSYRVDELELVKNEEEVKNYFHHYWIKGESPPFPEINSWVGFQLQKMFFSGSNLSDKELISVIAEDEVQSLLFKKSA